MKSSFLSLPAALLRAALLSATGLLLPSLHAAVPVPAVVAAAGLSRSLADADRQYRPREDRPFIYEDFSRCELLMQNGERIVLDEANINIVDGRIFFVEDGALKVSTRVPGAVRINGDDYILAGSRLMKVLRRVPGGAVLLDTVVDREAMSRADVGYGFMSSVSSTEKRNIFEGPNGAALSLRLESAESSARELILKEIKYIYINGGYYVRALRRDVTGIPWLDRRELGVFWRQNRVRYTDDDSLAALAEWVASRRE